MEKLVHTKCGALQGTASKYPGVIAFKGIRYATAERWKYPQIVTKWDGVYDASQYGAACYQPRSFYDESKTAEKAFYYNEFRKDEVYHYSEDCLFLNLFVPESAQKDSKLPVLFYIHGGGFTGGCGNEKHFDEPVWPLHDVIGVTINYRLGPLGFFDLPALKEEAGHEGNYGLFDQLTALQWIHDNIDSFGGDPSNITIMGQSAGAMSVQQLCFTPLSDGLFSKAVMSSGCGIMKGLSAKKPEAYYAFCQEIQNRTGSASLDELRKVPAEQLFDTWKTVKKEMKVGMMGPVQDGVYVVGDPAELINNGGLKNIPYLTGINSQDIAPIIFNQMMISFAKSSAKVNGGKSYAYFFDRQLPGDKNGAWHSADLWYWFGTLQNCWRPMEEKDHQLSDVMVSCLMNFCKNADPNSKELPVTWNSITASKGKVMRFGEGDLRMASVSKLKLLITTLTNKAVGE